MKTTKFFSFLLCLTTVIGVTSCLNDDDNNNSSKQLSKAEIAQCYLTVGGDYAGKLLYLSKTADGLSQKVDTIDGTWYIPTDSTLVITNFPAKVLAAAVSNNTALQEALAAAPARDVKCQMHFIQTSPVQFLVNPYALEYNLNYGGADHKVQIPFYYENLYSFGTFDAETRELMVQIIPAAVYVDEKQTNFLNSSQIVFVAKR